MATLNSNLEGWALRLPRAATLQLSAMRLAPAVEVAEVGDTVWLRGRQCDRSLDQLLRALPAEKRYAWLTNGRLRPNGSRLASELLPLGPWQSLPAWAPVRLPVAQLPSPRIPTAALRLERDFQARVSNAALVALRTWVEWVTTAPALRLAPLRFAASDDGQCLVLGEPLPAIPSQLWVETEGVVVPAGFAWRPRVTSKVIRRLVGASDDCSLLWDERGVRVLSPELFVPASRAAVRATAENRL